MSQNARIRQYRKSYLCNEVEREKRLVNANLLLIGRVHEHPSA